MHLQSGTAVPAQGMEPLLATRLRRVDCDSLPGLLTLGQAEPELTIKGHQVLGLDVIDTLTCHVVQQRDDVGMSDCLVALEAASPVIGAERLRQTLWPHLHASVRDDLERQSLGLAIEEGSRELIGSSVVLDKDIDSDGFLHGGNLGEFVFDHDALDHIRIAHRSEHRRLLAESLDNGIRELLGTHAGLALSFSIDVLGVKPIFQGLEPGVVDALGGFALSDVDEHHHTSEEKSARVGGALSGDARCAAVDGFEHSAVATDIRAARQSDRACDFRCNIAHDVAIEVRHHDDIPALRSSRDAGHSDVDNPVVLLDVRVLGTDFLEQLVEETIGQLHDVVLGHAGDALAAIRLRVLKRVADDASGSWLADELETLIDVLGLSVLDARVEIFLVLADDDHIHTLRADGDRRVIGDAGSHVGEETERLAHGDVETLETSALGSGDGGLQEDLGASEGFPRGIFDARAVASHVNGLANLNRLRGQGGACSGQDAKGGIHDLWADAIAMGDGNGDWGNGRIGEIGAGIFHGAHVVKHNTRK